MNIKLANLHICLGRKCNDGTLIVYGLMLNRSLEMNNLQHVNTTLYKTDI